MAQIHADEKRGLDLPGVSLPNLGGSAPIRVICAICGFNS